MEEQNEAADNRELYALLNLSPEASDEEIRRAYRQWAQVYHPDKYQAPHMKDIATENFQRICEAYEILSDPNKRQIYDIYGMEGLNSGLELGPRLDKAEEIKAELERLKRRKERERMSAHFQSSGTILANMSLPHCLDGDGLFRGMAMTSEIQSQLSKRNAVTIGGNLAVDGNEGGGAATALFRHQISEVSSVEFVAAAGLRALIGVQTSRNLSSHSAATMGIAMSLQDGSLNLSNLWTRQLSETASGHIQLALGPQSSIAVGWQKKDERRSASGEVKFGTSSFETAVHYTHRFSPKSLGCIAGRFGSSSLELEVGGGRKISKFSTVRWLYTVGIQGIFWKFELYRGGQKLIIPILLTRHLNPVFATGALVLPASLYFLLKVVKARNGSMPLALAMLYPFAVLLGGVLLWDYLSPSDIMGNYPHLVIIGTGLAFGFLVGRMILAHLCDEPKGLKTAMCMSLLYLPLAIANALTSRLNDGVPLINERLVLLGFCAFTVTFYLHFATSVIHEMTNALGIYCFRITKKEV